MNIDTWYIRQALLDASLFPLPVRVAAYLDLHGVSESELLEAAPSYIPEPLVDAVRNSLRDLKRKAPIYNRDELRQLYRIASRLLETS